MVCSKCVERKEEMKDMQWEIKDLEAEIYAMRMGPCGDRRCEATFKHKCGWRDKDEEDHRMALHREKVKVEKLISHINAFHSNFKHRVENGFQTYNINKAEMIENGEIKFIYDYSSFLENSNFFGVRAVSYTHLTLPTSP
jgi:hypothetical protein